MPGCAAIGCNNRSEKGYIMKCFPRDPVLRQIWKERVGRSDWEPSNNSFLCHMHFETSQWIVTHNGRVKLKKGALPSIFMVTSTRKSSKKRGISESDNGENCDDYFVEYLQGDGQSLDASQSEAVVWPIKMQDSAENMENDSVYLISNENVDIEKLLNDGNYADNEKLEDSNSNVNVNSCKTEIKREVEDRLSNDEYIQIEKRLKLVCDGEKYEDLINKHELSEGVENFETDDHKHDITRQGLIDIDFSEKIESPKKDFKVPMDEELKFTIKISGVPEDVYEITQNLDSCVNVSKPADVDCDDKKFITSEIIVNHVKRNDANVNLLSEDESSRSEELLDAKQDTVSSNLLLMNKLLQKCKELETKVDIKQQIINRISEQSTCKDTNNVTAEADEKWKDEFELSKGKNAKRNAQANRKSGDKVDAQTEVDEPLLFKITSKINQLEATNKQLMKSLNAEIEKRRKAEYQVKDRENKIKELNWKLDKASKFYERSEKNTNNYRRKLSTLQTLLRRKNIMADKKQMYEELSSEHSQGVFSKRSMTAALSILKSCGHRGYTKLLSYNFPLPSLNMLLHKSDSPLKNVVPEANSIKTEATGDKSEGLELASGTVQDIFNESSDDDYTMDINELKKYVLVDDHPS